MAVTNSTRTFLEFITLVLFIAGLCGLVVIAAVMIGE